MIASRASSGGGVSPRTRRWLTRRRGAASTWAAVRHRRGQSVALVLVSALVTTCAVFAPMFVRTLEQGLLRARLVEREPADTTVLLRTARTVSDPGASPADLATAMPPEALPGSGTGSG